MESALSSACLAKIQAASKPMSLSEISAACLGRREPNAELKQALKQLTDRAEIHEWPSYRRSPLFGGRSLRSAVEDAFVAVLDEAPFTIAKAAKSVSQAVGRVSEENARNELRAVASKLAGACKIVQVPISRQSVVYMSLSYVGRLAPTQSAAEATNTFDQLIITAVNHLQSGPGNFVPVEELRKSSAIRDFIDAAIISLADQGKLVLGRYGGPRPEDDVERTRFLEDRKGQLFVGIATPRND
jgi:hypothetical protein